MKTLSLKLSSHELNGFAELLAGVLVQTVPVDLEDKLLLAVLKRFHKRLTAKIYDVKPENEMLLQPEEALALAIVHERADLDVTTQIGNSMLTLSNQIHQQFN